MTTQPDLIVNVPIEDILSNIHQPRQTFDDASLAELAASIIERGVIQPLIIYRNTGEECDVYHFRLIAGERRLRAAQLAGLIDVPCLIRETAPDTQTEFEMALIENIQRENLSPADEARAYVRLRDEFHLTDEQIAQRVGKAAVTIRGSRRLAELPAAVLDLIGDGQGQLRVRDARRLIPVARLVKAEDLVKAAAEIATLDADERRSIDARLGRLIEKTATVIDRQDAIDFPAKPIALAAPIAGLTEMTACTRCEFYLKLSNGYGSSTHYCLNAACYARKKELIADSELKRASKALSIPAVGQGEQASVLTLDYGTLDKVRKWIANPPAHLRLTTNGNPSRKDNYYHRDLTKSPVVFIASTQPHLLNNQPDGKTGSGKVVTGGVASSVSVNTLSKDALAKETAEEKAARLKREEQARKEQEEADRKERLAYWKVLGQKRKALADTNWLVVDTAGKLASKVPLTGLWLEIFANQVEDDYVEFDSASIRLDDIEKELHKTTKAAEREALLREKVMLLLICDGSPNEDDWPAVKKHVTEFITGKPGKNGAGGLGLKYTIPEPPIQHTEANCWTCGAYAPYDELKQEQINAGWSSLWQGEKCLDMKCPDCTKKANKAPSKPATKPAAKKGAK